MNTRRLAVLCLAAALAGCAAVPADQAAAPGGGELGIRVDSLRLTAADYLLDLRFHVTDPERAAPFFSRKSEIELLDPDSGARLAVPDTPKLGKLRQVARRDMTARSYFMLFANPGRFVKPGSRLTLVVGEQRLQDLLVEGTGDPHDPSPRL